MVSPQSGLLSSPACLRLVPMYENKKKKNARIYFFKAIRFHSRCPRGIITTIKKEKRVTCHDAICMVVNVTIYSQISLLPDQI